MGNEGLYVKALKCLKATNRKDVVRLSVFPASFGAEGAGHVLCGISAEKAQERLSSLHGKGLLQFDSSVGMYHMHQQVRGAAAAEEVERALGAVGRKAVKSFVELVAQHVGCDSPFCREHWLEDCRRAGRCKIMGQSGYDNKQRMWELIADWEDYGLQLDELGATSWGDWGYAYKNVEAVYGPLANSDATRNRHPEFCAKVCCYLAADSQDASRSRALYEKAFQHWLSARKEGTTRAECLSSFCHLIHDDFDLPTVAIGFANELVLDAVRRLECTGGIESDKDQVLLQAIELMAANFVYLESHCRRHAGNGPIVIQSSESLADPDEVLCNIMCVHFEQSLRPSPLQAGLRVLLHETMHDRFKAWGDASKRKDLAEQAEWFICRLAEDKCPPEAIDLASAVWRLSKDKLGAHHEVSVRILTNAASHYLIRYWTEPGTGCAKYSGYAQLQGLLLGMYKEGVEGAEIARVRSGQSPIPYKPEAHMELLMRYGRYLPAAGKEVSSLGCMVFAVAKEMRDEDMLYVSPYGPYGEAPGWLEWLINDAPLDKWSCAVELLKMIRQRVLAEDSVWNNYQKAAQQVATRLEAAMQLAVSAATPPQSQQQAQKVTAPTQKAGARAGGQAGQVTPGEPSSKPNAEPSQQNPPPGSLVSPHKRNQCANIQTA